MKSTKENNFTILIRTYRALKGFTMRDASLAMGISAPYLSDLENGFRKPNKKIIEALIRVYNLTGAERAVLYDFAGEANDSIGIDVIEYLKNNREALLRVREEMKGMAM